MEVKIESSWKEALGDEFDKPYFSDLRSFVRSEYKNGTCYPPAKMVFNAFDHCSFDDAKVVIVGQDPLSRAGASQRTVLFGERRCASSTVTKKYF